MEPELPSPPPKHWRAHLDVALEYRRLADGGRKALQPLIDREFALALERVPPAAEDHLALVEAATRLGELDTLKVLYVQHERDWDFAPQMLAGIAAIERAQAAAREAPIRSRHAGDWLQFGGFVLGAKDLLIWGAKKWFGPHGPWVIASALFAFMLYLVWPFLLEMYRLWNAY